MNTLVSSPKYPLPSNLHTTAIKEILTKCNFKQNRRMLIWWLLSSKLHISETEFVLENLKLWVPSALMGASTYYSGTQSRGNFSCDQCNCGQNLPLFRRACEHVDVGTCPHQVLVSTLTLSQPGGQTIPTLYWCPHQVLEAKGAPALGWV